MKLTTTCFTFFLFFFVLSATTRGQDNLIELPIKIVEGYGPTYPGYIGPNWQSTSADNPWVKTHHSASGIPADWQQVKEGSIWLDAYQLVYQHVQSGAITPAFYKELQDSWHWTPDTSTLSAKPIRCFVSVVKGIDKNGKLAVLMDTDNDLDFSDETPFSPEERDVTGLVHNPHRVQYERYRNGKIIPAETVVTVVRMEENIMYNFPQHAVA